ncbi:MAG: hypothetical protein AMXMBFR77_18340 [Phycisphaerales bacterium]|nr:M28 family peptidase [Phycisphaerales bacterium]GIK19541.1 MAG: hypothetical protein BroJett004_17050 [Planctomycetota bacterium]
MRRLPLALLLVLSPSVSLAGDGTDVKDAIASLGESPISTLLINMPEDVQTYDKHVTTLANPFFEGRAPGLRGNRDAAEYIRFYFQRFGLKPAFPETVKAADGAEVRNPFASYFQYFEHGRNFEIRGSAVEARAGDAAPMTFRQGEDYVVLGSSGSGDFTGPLVFVGYSIVSGKDGYMGYQPADSLEGKVALAFRFEPMNEEGHSLWSETGDGWSFMANLEPKISAAARRGAKAVVVVNPPGAADERANRLATVDETRAGTFDVPVIMLTADAADRLVRAADPEGRSLMDLRRLADASGVVLDLPGAAVTVRTDVDRSPILTPNVGGVLPGRGTLADEYVVIGAHFDHVGYGSFGTGATGQLHPGADDNASGTSGMLLAAEKLARLYAALPDDASARSILFLGFTAEESGLVGSRYYANNPIVPIDRHVLMLNMDMIGRVRERAVHVGGLATGEGLEEFTRPFLEQSGLDVKPMPAGVFGRSDHASFYAKDVPVLFFFSGFHDDYHKPGDVSVLINRNGAVDVVNAVSRIALAMAQRAETLPFVPDSADGRRASENLPRLGQGQGRGGSRVRVGIRPGYDENGRGVLIEEVTPNTAAAEAGMLAGDVMTRWNGQAVGSVTDWMPLFRDAQPGDKVEVVVLRNGEEVTLTLTLRAAGARE